MDPRNGNGLEEYLEILSEHDRQIKRSLGESYAIMSHFSPEVKKNLSEMVVTLERAEDNIQKTINERLEHFDERVDEKINELYKLSRLFTFKGLICVFVAAMVFGIFLGRKLSEDLYFEEARTRKILQHERDIEIMANLRKRGVGIYTNVLLAPPKVVESTGKSTKGDHGIWLKP